MSTERVEAIRQRLTERFTPTRLEIIDETHRHAGHAGAASGGGHFIIHINAPDLDHRSPLERHRLIYAALDDMMESEIHALSIQS